MVSKLIPGESIPTKTLALKGIDCEMCVTTKVSV